MQILLTNDDGYSAPGISKLYEVLSEEYDLQISIVAPESQKSATSHSITLFEPLFVARTPLKHGLTGLSVRGNPADCVKLAIQGGIIPLPDLVISGINEGPNLGTDVFYSGTVSAAMEGVLLGIPSLAVSLAAHGKCDFEPAARFILRMIKEGLLPDQHLWNINIPSLPEREWKGVKFTKLGKAIYENVFEERKTPNGREYYWLAGTMTPETDTETDQFALQEGFVSVSPMHSDLTDYGQLTSLRRLEAF